MKVFRKKEVMKRKLVFNDTQLECTGFLSTPNIHFQEDQNHKATVAEESFLMRDLVSNDILNLFTKEKAVLISCGFEHCLCLMSNGDVYTWGYGGSGCLGHGNYESLETPKKVEVNCRYAQAGGYHNAVIGKEGEVYTWGRGDVGQLGVDEVVKDQMGLVALKPVKVKI